MGQMIDKTQDQMNSWRWNTPCAFRDQVDSSSPQTTSSGKVECNGKLFSCYCCDDLWAKIEPPSCQQYKLGYVLGFRPLNWNEIIDEDDDVKNRADPGAPRGGRSLPAGGNDNDNGEGVVDTEGTDTGPVKVKGTKDGKGKRMATEHRNMKEKGKGKGNGTRTCIVKPTQPGDDVSSATAMQLQKGMYEADSDTES